MQLQYKISRSGIAVRNIVGTGSISITQIPLVQQDAVFDLALVGAYKYILSQTLYTVVYGKQNIWFGVDIHHSGNRICAALITGFAEPYAVAGVVGIGFQRML